MVTYEIVSATQEHAEEVALKMRQVDVDEVWAAWHVTPAQAISMSMRGTRDTKAGLVDGKVMCIFGVAQRTALSTTGCPWLMATPRVKKHAMAFLRGTRGYMDKIKGQYAVLQNYGDARNTEAFRWMRWLGFTIFPAEPYGVEQLPFHKFLMYGDA
jgi:hypothetical protein